jgi:molybdate transport system substrate-binding protein
MESRKARGLTHLAGIVLALACAACGGDHAKVERRNVHVYAASSLRAATEEIAKGVEAQHPELKLVLNFAASNVLAQQALAAKQADVFLSADTLQVELVAKGGLVEREAPRPWLSNQLVVVVPTNSKLAELDGAKALAQEAIVHLSLGNPEAVPVGRYAKAWLEQTGMWDALKERVVPGTDVRAALAAVESGACEAGIVYSTDAEASERVRVVFRVPLSEGPKIEYSLGLLRGQAAAADARAVFERFLARPAQDVFVARGFLVGGV